MKKPIAIFTSILLVANMTLAVLGFISWKTFWLIIILAVGIAYGIKKL